MSSTFDGLLSRGGDITESDNLVRDYWFEVGLADNGGCIPCETYIELGLAGICCSWNDSFIKRAIGPLVTTATETITRSIQSLGESIANSTASSVKCAGKNFDIFLAYVEHSAFLGSKLIGSLSIVVGTYYFDKYCRYSNFYGTSRYKRILKEVENNCFAERSMDDCYIPIKTILSSWKPYQR